MTDAPDPMPVDFVVGEVIYHFWDEDHRLIESARVFRSLDELLTNCVAPPAGHLVDRIAMKGRDAQGRRRRLVLSFQSLTEA